MKWTVCLFLITALNALGQLEIPSSIQKLNGKAKEVVEVNLDPATLSMAAKFLSDKDPDQIAAKKLITGLKGIQVRSYEFSKEGEYSDADLEAMRSQMKGPDWSCIVKVRSREEREDVDVCFHRSPSGDFSGMGIIAAEKLELTVVSISGAIDPEQLRLLDGQFGIPRMHLGNHNKERRKTEKPEKPEKPD